MTIDKVNAIILDMDGTLVNTEQLWKQAEKDMLNAYDRQYDAIKHAQFLGMAVHEFIPALQKVYDLLHIDTKQLENELEDRSAVILREQTAPTDGAVELIQYIVDNTISCAIASNSSHKMIRTTLSNQHWLDIIPKRFSSDDVPNAKPAPDLYLHVAQQLEVQPEDCLAIEDSLTGVRSATGAGMTCFAVPDHELSNTDAYRQITPYVFNSLVEVLEFIKTNTMISNN